MIRGLKRIVQVPLMTNDIYIQPRVSNQGDILRRYSNTNTAKYINTITLQYNFP